MLFLHPIESQDKKRAMDSSGGLFFLPLKKPGCKDNYGVVGTVMGKKTSLNPCGMFCLLLIFPSPEDQSLSEESQKNSKNSEIFQTQLVFFSLSLKL